jgi:hypothetical protein
MSGVLQALLAGFGGAATDEYFEYVTMLLPGNGTNGAQNNTFLDSSTNNFTITRNGNTTQGTFTPYGSNWSNYFDGTGDYLSGIGTTSSFNFMHNTTALFTFECWVYWQGTAPQVLFTTNNTGSANIGVAVTVDTGSVINLYITRGVSGASNVVCNANSVSTVPLNTWTHIACTYDQSLGSNNAKIYINGALDSQTTKLANAPSSSNATYAAAIGGGNTGIYTFTGYISNLRVTNSIVYASAFTPSTSPLTAITNTSLLTCQSNRFIDNSSNNFTITRNGDVSVQRFSPFAPTAAYSTSVIGGSGYFDGSGDYLNGPTTGQFAPTGDFTISMWFYPTSFAASYYVLAGSWNAGASDEWLIQYDNTGAIRFLTTTDSTFSAAGVVKLNQWQFLSISRSGSTVTGYINGTSFRSYTLTGTVGSATKTVYVGIQAGTTWPYVGYISDYRLVAGSAQSATPPTSPATAISGTNTLLNFTNGGIIDNAMMNDLETVGNAQISTSVSKFGGGSMYFDGTGDYLQIPNSQNFVFGAGNWTVECWVYLNSTARQGFVALENSSGTNVAWELGLNASTKFRVLVQTSAGQVVIDGTTTPTTGVWYHLAAVRNGSTVTLYVNGTSEATGSVSTNAIVAESSPVFVGQYGYGFQMNGYIDDLRITKGIARYTANFTPPTSQFQDQ